MSVDAKPYSLEFRREAVRLLRTSSGSIPQLARELGLLVSVATQRGAPSKEPGDELEAGTAAVIVIGEHV